MRVLEKADLVAVSGGTSIYDYRCGDPGVDPDGEFGPMWDPLNTGNSFTDFVNAGMLVATGEISPQQFVAMYGDVMPMCWPSDLGPCELPSGNYIVNGMVVAATQGGTPGENVDWAGVMIDLASIGVAAGSGMGGVAWAFASSIVATFSALHD